MTRRGALLGLVLLLVGLFAVLSGGTEPASAQTPTTPVLVSNLGQPDGGTGGLQFDHAQSFTTGGNPRGYTLTSIDWEFASTGVSGDGGPAMTVTIHSDSGGNPGTTVVGTLVSPVFSLISADTVFRFTAPGAGIHLQPDRRYWAVLDLKFNISLGSIRNTASDGEDVGGAAGFSIGDSSLYRHWATSSGGWTSWGESKKIRINGDVINQLRMEYDPIAFPGQPIEVTVKWDAPLDESMQLLVGVGVCSGTRFSWCTSGTLADASDFTDPRFHLFTMAAGEQSRSFTFYAAEDGERHAERGTVSVRCMDTDAKCTDWIAPIDRTYRGGSLEDHDLTTQQHSSGMQFHHPLLIDVTRYWNAGEACGFAPAAFARNSDYSLILDNRGDPYVTERFVWCGEYSYLQGVKSSKSPAGQHYRGEFMEVLSAPNKVQTGDQPTNDEPTNYQPQVQPVGQQSQCVTEDQELLDLVESRTRDPWNGGRPDLLEMFTRTYNTMRGSDDYTTADIRARPDKQGAEWQANGPNALWRSIYAELDRLGSCRADEQAEPVTPEISIAGGGDVSEGGDAQFTVTASPAPGADLTVSVTVSASGDYGVTTGTRSVTIPTTGSATLTVGTTDDDVDEADGSVTATVTSGTGYTVSSSQGASTVAVADDDDAPVADEPTDDAASSCVTTDTALLAQVEAKTQDPWDGGRPDLLEMFTRSHNTMQGSDDYTTADIRARPDKQAAEWQANGPNALWQSVYAELDALETCRAGSSEDAAPPPPTPEIGITAASGGTEGGDAVFTLTANPAPSADLDVSVTVTALGDYGVTTGTRSVTIPTTGSATLTLSTDDDAVDEPDGSVTVTLNADTGYTVGALSSETVAILDNDDPQQQDPPPPTPEISISGGDGVTEGGGASFTLTASPAPSADLTVTVTVAASGDYGVTTGTQSVTIPTTGSATLTVATSDDAVDEADGSVTVTVDTGAGYDVSSSAGSATVAVSDDDVPEISITAGTGVTEGGTASFTLTASPAPSADLAVSVTVSASGDYGVTTGTQSVTIPSSGSATLTIGTTDDAVDEADGSVTVTVDSGTGYDVSSSAGSATAAVADDDDPPVQNEEPEPPASDETGGVTVSSITTEASIVNIGGKDTIIEFTVTLSEPAPEGGVAVGFTGEGPGWIANPNMDYSIEESDSVTDDRTQEYDTVLRGTLTIGASETQGTIRVKVNANAYIPGRSVLLDVSVETVGGEALDTPLATTVVVRK